MVKANKLIFMHCVVLILVYSNAQYNNLDDYTLSFERLDAVFPNPDCFVGNATSRKVNRTMLIHSLYRRHKIPINYGDMTLKIKAFQFLSNTYRLTAMQFEIEYCLTLKKGQYGLDEFKKNSNVPSECPVPSGDYYVKDGKLSTDIGQYLNTFPPNFVGKWKLQIIFALKNETGWYHDIYFKVLRVPKWNNKKNARV